MAAKKSPSSLISPKSSDGNSDSDIDERKPHVTREAIAATPSNEGKEEKHQNIAVIDSNEKNGSVPKESAKATCNVIKSEPHKNNRESAVLISKYYTHDKEILINFLKNFEEGKTEYDTPSVIQSLKRTLNIEERCQKTEENERKHFSCSQCTHFHSKVDDLNKQIKDLKCENCKHLSEIEALNKLPKIVDVKEITGGTNTFAQKIENKYKYDPIKANEEQKKIVKLREDKKDLTVKVNECQLHHNNFNEIKKDLESKHAKCKEFKLKLADLQIKLNKEIDQKQSLKEQLDELSAKLMTQKNEMLEKDNEIEILKQNYKKKDDEVKEKCIIIYDLRLKYGDMECLNPLVMESIEPNE